MARYDAFLSYHHGDGAMLAAALERGLGRFAKPWYRRRALRLFRDERELSANPALWPSILAALDDSRVLIYVGSPGAARSPWTAREVEHFRAGHPKGPILLVVAAGSILWSGEDFDFERSTALSPALRGAFRQEPRWVDLTWAAGLGAAIAADPRFPDALADLAAPLHGRSKAEIHGEDLRQHRRTLGIAWSAATVMAALAFAALILAIAAIRARTKALRAEETAVQRYDTAKEALDLLVREVRFELSDLPGRAVKESRGRMLGHALTSLEELGQLGAGADPRAPSLVDTFLELGDLAREVEGGARARRHYERAEEIAARLAANDAQDEQALLYLARTARLLADLDIEQDAERALARYEAALRTAMRAMGLAAQPETELVMAEIEGGVAQALARLGRETQAEASLRSACARCERAEREPSTAQRARSLGVELLGNLASHLRGRYRFEDLVPVNATRERLARALLEAQIDGRVSGCLGLASVQRTWAAQLGWEGRFDEATAALTRGRAELEAVLALEPDSRLLRSEVASMALNAAELALTIGAFDRAESLAAEALDSANVLVRADPTDAEHVRLHASVGLVRARLLWGSNRSEAAVEELELAIEEIERLAESGERAVEDWELLADAHAGLSQASQSLGRLHVAIEAARSCVAVREQVCATLPQSRLARLAHARARAELGRALHDAGQALEARTEMRAASAWFEALHVEAPEDHDLGVALVVGTVDMMKCLFPWLSPEEAVRIAETALEQAEGLIERYPSSASAREAAALAHLQRATQATLDMQSERAVSARSRAIELYRDLVARGPSNVKAKLGLIAALQVSPVLQRTASALGEFEADQEEAIQIMVALVAQRPGDVQLILQLVRARDERGVTFLGASDFRSAAGLFQENVELLNALAGDDDPRILEARARSEQRVGTVLGAEDDAGGALAHYRASVAAWRRVVAGQDPLAVAWQELSVALNLLGPAELASGDTLAALACHREAIEIRARFVDASPNDPLPRAFQHFGFEGLIRAHVAGGDRDAAQEVLEQLEGNWRALEDREPQYLEMLGGPAGLEALRRELAD